MSSVVSSDGPILASAIPPDGTVYYQKWLDTNTGILKEYSGSEWVPVNGGGMNLAYDGSTMEITKLTIVNGLVTELEYET